MLDSYRAMATAMAEDGRVHLQPFIRTTAPVVNTAGLWGDLSVGSGSPRYNAYTGSQLEATPFVNFTNNGIHTGPEPDTDEEKRITGLGVVVPTTSVPLTYQLIDYLLFVPLIDGDDAADQVVDNAAALPRYADGQGVMAFAVSATPINTSVTATMTYTNQAGVGGRTTTFSINATPNIGVIVNREGTSLLAGSATPFISLQTGDTGIRHVDSVLMGSGAGGYFHVVLCRPLGAAVTVREGGVWTYESLAAPRVSPVKILPGAFLQFLFLSSPGTTPALTLGMLEITRG